MRDLGTMMVVTLAAGALAGCAGVPASTCPSRLSTLAASGAHISPSLTMEQVKQREINRTSNPGPASTITRSGTRRVTAAQLRQQQAAELKSLLVGLRVTATSGDTIHFVSTTPGSGGPIASGQDGFVVVQEGCVAGWFGTIQY